MFNFKEASDAAARKVVAEMAQHGRVTPLEFSADVMSGKVTIAEMIGTADGAAEFLEKITFDLAAGQQQVPLLYKSIYTTQTDANFPLVLTEKTIGDVQTVFLEKFEGGEISFGAVSSGKEVTVRMHTYASGIEYDEDIAEYNQTWRVAAIGESFGRSYNQLMNHLHLSAIVNATYATGVSAAASQATLLAAARAQKGYVGTDGNQVNGVAQHILGAEHFDRHFLGNHHRADGVERCLRITLQKREIEHTQECRVGDNGLAGYFLVARTCHKPPGVIARNIAHFRVLRFQGRAEHLWGRIPALQFAVEGPAVPGFIQVILVAVEAVVTDFIVHPEKYEQRARHAHG